MPSYKVLGIYSFADNLKEMNVNDVVILKKNILNIRSKNAIAVYSLDNKKLGYLPVENDDELKFHNNSYKICKIVLSNDNAILEIKRDYKINNYLDDIEHPIVKEIKYSKMNIITVDHDLKSCIERLQKELKRKKINVKQIVVTYMNENYINLLIETNKGISTYYMVTRKYYKENQDKYNELFEYNLISNMFFQELHVHRLEKYYEANYTNIDNLNLVCNYSLIEDNIHNKLKMKKKLNWNMYLRFLITKDLFYFNEDINDYVENSGEINKFMHTFNNINLGKFMYDHKKKIYGYINFENDEYIFDIEELKNVFALSTKNIIIYYPELGLIKKYINNL